MNEGRCCSCQFFTVEEIHPDGRGWCALNNDIYLPTGHCKGWQKKEDDQPKLEF